MSEHNLPLRGRTFLAGKIISNFGQSSIDCIIRRISDDGAIIEVESAFGVPEHFHLLIPDEGPPRPCQRKWQSEKQIGVAFETSETGKTPGLSQSRRHPSPHPNVGAATGSFAARCWRCARRSTKWKSASCCSISDMRAQFINRAFRRMWALPDAVADRHPAFVALMYHGRDTKAYQIPGR